MGRGPRAVAAVIDSRSVWTAEAAAKDSRGYVASKKTSLAPSKGRRTQSWPESCTHAVLPGTTNSSSNTPRTLIKRAASTHDQALSRKGATPSWTGKPAPANG